MRIIPIRNEVEAQELIRRIGPDQAAVEIMSPKAVHRVIYVKNVSTPAALILKQEMLARGGEAAINRAVIVARTEMTDVLLMGTLQQYRQVLHRLRQQPFGLKGLAVELEAILGTAEGLEPSPGLKCGAYQLPLGQRTLIMGILNLTPDSFSDGGQFNQPEVALARARQLVEDGADLIDVGAESTRPGAQLVTAEEEWARLAPVLPLLLRELSVPISLDTYKVEVARKALDLGVGMINDIWGLRADPEMAQVIAQYGVPVVVMHNREQPHYQDLMAEIVQDLGYSLALADQAGIDPQNIILDPGIGFGKTLEHNLEVMQRLAEIRSLGKPILIGTSRKSMIGQVLKVPVVQRLEGTIATVVLGINGGADLVRVHDVRSMALAVQMTDAMVRFSSVGPGRKAKDQIN
ncbi:MAG: dihydropteroate synthase [Syntrophomonadaceae bacterium]|nr:dihydropteroate synthase [Syntrophomonadaceae bacterium]